MIYGGRLITLLACNRIDVLSMLFQLWDFRFWIRVSVENCWDILWFILCTR
jgi:hypothetical protein